MAVGVRRPGAHRDGPASGSLLRERRDDNGEGGELLGGGVALDDPEQRLVAHNGMFPCFLGGSVWRLLASTRSALVTWMRVWDGGITASTYPRSAAT